MPGPSDPEWTRAIEDHLSRASGKLAQLSRFQPLLGGACQDNLLLELSLDGTAHRLVLRSDAPGALPFSLGRRHELAVIETAVAHGVPTPAARWLAPDLLRPGCDAYFLEFAEGVAIGAKVLKDPALEAARAELPFALARALAAIHRITPERAPELSLPADAMPSGDPVAHALVRERATLDRLPVERPALEWVFRWLQDHPPSSREVTLVHGDFRTGNYLVTPAGLSAILDWEFAHFGSPLEDVAWFCVRDWRFQRIDRAAGGLCERKTFYRAYAEASGRALDAADVHWWEIMGNLRWALGALEQGRRYASGEKADLELLAIARRASEMELEAVRLCLNGPPAM